MAPPIASPGLPDGPRPPAYFDCKLIRFATQAEGDEMQCWIAASGIETRPAHPRYDGPQLTVAGGSKDRLF